MPQVQLLSVGKQIHMVSFQELQATLHCMAYRLYDKVYAKR